MLSNDCDLNVQSIMVICYSNNALKRCIELLMTNLYTYKKNALMMKHSQGFYRLSQQAFQLCYKT